ncbi:MAG: hypothetical protein ACLGJC_24130 [Alphaproteobacteria bacterium]
MSGVTNNRIRGALSWRQAKPVLLHPKLFLGFIDFQAGQPFDYRRLDGWAMLDQHRYENGRELAAECKAAGIAVVWTDRTRIPRPLKTLVMERALSRSPAESRKAEQGGGRLRPWGSEDQGGAAGANIHMADADGR